MVSLAALWLPIVLSAVIVFVASSIMHVVLTYHQSDCKQIPEEEKVLAQLRGVGLKPGYYHFPFANHKEMKAPATMERFKQGPVGIMTVIPSGPPAMPKYLVSWFVYCLLIGFFVAYLTGHTVASGSNFLVVFRVAGTAGFMSYGLGQMASSIWKGQPWSMTIKEVVDGLIYALLTAGTFGWLWPK